MSIRKVRKQIHFHSKQRWGISIVIIMILSVLLYGQLSTWNHTTTPFNNLEHQEILNSLQTKVESRKKIVRKKRKNWKRSITPKPFDPNTVTKDELVNMGIKESVAKSWTKYTSKGGQFRTPQDLKKLYSMNDYLYEKLVAFVKIKKVKRENKAYTHSTFPRSEKHSGEYKSLDSNYIKENVHQDSNARKEYNSKFNKNRNKKSSGVAEDYVISINSTDSIELKMLKGIGQVLSSRIIQYRDKLGGFHNMNQLLEVYGVKPGLVGSIIDQLDFKGPLQKIPLNTITVDSLVKHPYFDYPTANIFINYRIHHGDYKNIKDVKKIIAIKDYWLEEAAPYFSYSPSK